MSAPKKLQTGSDPRNRILAWRALLFEFARELLVSPQFRFATAGEIADELRKQVENDRRYGPPDEVTTEEVQDALLHITELARSDFEAPRIGRMASDIPPANIKWLWKNRIPRGKLSVLDADPAAGKSLFTQDLAARGSAGRDFPDGEKCELFNSILLASEDTDDDTIVPRLRAAGGDLTKIRIIPSEIELNGELHPITFPADIALIEQEIRADAAQLVVMDAFFSFISEKVDSHKDASIRRVLAELAAMAQRTGAAIILVRHFNKLSGEQKAMYRGGGSIAISAAARVVYAIGYDPTDGAPLPERPRVLAAVKNNLAPLPQSLAFHVRESGDGVPRLEWIDGACDVCANDLLASPRKRKSEALEEAKDFLRYELSEGPRREEEIRSRAAELRISKSTLKRAKHQLKVVSRKLKEFEGKWIWALLEHEDGGRSLDQPPIDSGDMEFP